MFSTFPLTSEAKRFEGDRPLPKGDREGRPYKDYETDIGLGRIFVGATLAVALFIAIAVHLVSSRPFHSRR